MEHSTNQEPADKVQRIRFLNDEFRQKIPHVKHFYATDELQETFSESYDSLLEAIKIFDDFTADNDREGDHSDVTIEFMGHKVRWEIQYLDSKYLAEFISSGEDWADYHDFFGYSSFPEDSEMTVRSIMIEMG